MYVGWKKAGVIGKKVQQQTNQRWFLSILMHVRACEEKSAINRGPSTVMKQMVIKV